MMTSGSTDLKAFFQQPVRVPFEQLETVLIKGRATFQPGTNINIRNVFNNVPIYEIPNYERGKNKEVKIPHPGIPYVVLSAKHGREVRGIVKRLNQLKEKKGNEGRFPNQVALDIALRDKVVNVMIFSNMMNVSGSTKPEHLAEAFVFVKALLTYMQTGGVPVFEQSPILTKLDIDMENVVFDLGFTVRRDALVEQAEQRGLFCPQDKEAAKILYPMNKTKKKGGERYYTFRVMHTGKVVFSGDNRAEMAPLYGKFLQFISEVEPDVRFY
jgi:hypothetical protein